MKQVKEAGWRARQSTLGAVPGAVSGRVGAWCWVRFGRDTRFLTPRRGESTGAGATMR